MGTVQKRADELRPGDVVVMAPSNGGARGMILQSAAQEHYSGGIEAIYFHVAILSNLHPIPTKWGWEPEVELDVESPDLTPAQQHAEELADALDWLVNDERSSDQALYNEKAPKFRALLDKIKPPEPPTLEEALEALQRMAKTTGSVQDVMREDANKLLDRARRAGILK